MQTYDEASAVGGEKVACMQMAVAAPAQQQASPTHARFIGP